MTQALDTLAGLHARRLRPELMDDPAIDAVRLEAALRGIQRLNRASFAARLLWGPIRHLAARERRCVRLLDLGSGGGDVLRALWRRARRSGVALEIVGTDVSAVAVGYARRVAQARGAAVAFERLDAVRESLPEGFDVISSSLFLHHLSTADCTSLLRRMREAAGRMVLVSDLRRCAWGLGLATVCAPLLTRSEVVHADSVQSVRAAFTADELRGLAREAGMADAVVRPRFPARVTLEWSRRK